MNSEAAYAQIAKSGLMAGMRGSFPPDHALRTADVLMRADITVFELTMNSVQPIDAMQALKREYGDAAVVGMGTVLNAESARRALDAGADFVVAPSFDPGMISAAQSIDTLAIPGVMTPTEIVDAWNTGAKLLKIFPIGDLGVDYFKTVRGPLDQVHFICNGGMTDHNVGAFLAAGAVACGMAGWLTGDGSMELDVIARRAALLRDIVTRARAETAMRHA
jgi:2-dehydro-3-deoxyphosphogluconate aldolase/(4S)-4-hydroxy-2-oxoglutarate aldolase